MEQKCDTDHPNWSRNVDTEERLFKRVLKAYRNSNNPKLNRFAIMTDDGPAYVEGRIDGVYIEIIGEQLTLFVGTAIAATNLLICHGADYATIEEVKSW